MIFNLRQRMRLSALFVVASACAFGASAAGQDGSIEPPLQLIAEQALHSLARPTGRDAGSTEEVDRQPDGALADWDVVAAHLLDDMRGGAATSMNLSLSFGLERAVYLNGALVTTTSFKLPSIVTDLADGSVAALPSSSVSLLQNGPGNVVATQAGATPIGATFIQNSLNGQSIQSLTTINAQANSLEILRTNSFNALIGDGIRQAVVPR